MKKLYLLSIITLMAFVLIYSCSTEEEDIHDINHEDFFECTVDFVQFVDDQNAIVRFETTLGDQTNYFYGRYSYVKDGNDYEIGDDLVYIRNFELAAKGEATFRFIYGESLGFFCAQIFETLPVHVHQNFDAEAELVIDPADKGVGKWRIRKKSNYSSN
jgi:hypothetical protein